MAVASALHCSVWRSVSIQCSTLYQHRFLAKRYAEDGTRQLTYVVGMNWLWILRSIVVWPQGFADFILSDRERQLNGVLYRVVAYQTVQLVKEIHPRKIVSRRLLVRLPHQALSFISDQVHRFHCNNRQLLLKITHHRVPIKAEGALTVQQLPPSPINSRTRFTNILRAFNHAISSTIFIKFQTAREAHRLQLDSSPHRF